MLYTASWCNTENTTFEFAKKDAPTYATLNIGHVQITSYTDDDNKMIASQKDGFAVLKAEGQSILKSDVYTHDSLTLWLDTACLTFEETMPLYYLSTNAFAEEGVKTRNYLMNTLDSAEVKGYAYEAAGAEAVRAAFIAGSVCGIDSIAIKGDTINAMNLNPAYDEEAAEEQGEEYDVEKYLPRNAYLAHLNNVVYWTTDPEQAEVFKVMTTSTPTSNDKIAAESAISVVANAGTVTIQGAAGKSVVISNILGKVNRRELAIIALVGGFIAPFLVGSGDGSYWVLFTYVMILDLGMFGLSIYKKWGELPVICFALTWIVFAGYTYAADLDLMGSVQLMHLLIFSIAFYLIFLLSVASIVRINIRGINQYLLGVIGLNNFVFLFFALCLLQNMELERNYKGLVTLFVAAINFALFFWIKRKGEPFSFFMHTLLGIALTFVSVTIPIQLEGTFITLFWASEVMIILWFYSRFRLRVYEIFAWVLPVLTLGSYGMDVFHGWMEARYGDSSLFINGLFATGIFTGLSYWVDAWLVRPTRISTKGPLLTGCAVLYTAFVFDFYSYVDPSIVSFSYIETFTVAVLFAANVLLGKSYLPVSRNAGGYGLLLGRYYYKSFDAREKRTHGMTLYICLLSTILLAVGTNNLLNQLGLLDELSAGFSISLSLAGFMQMAVGMRSHLKVVRMISLATFSLVLLKLVMVDLWLLPTIGKVVVFIILGVILLVLSFLYQKLKTVLFDDSL